MEMEDDSDGLQEALDKANEAKQLLEQTLQMEEVCAAYRVGLGLGWRSTGWGYRVGLGWVGVQGGGTGWGYRMGVQGEPGAGITGWGRGRGYRVGEAQCRQHEQLQAAVLFFSASC